MRGYSSDFRRLNANKSQKTIKFVKKCYISSKVQQESIHKTLINRQGSNKILKKSPDTTRIWGKWEKSRKFMIFVTNVATNLSFTRIIVS